MTPPPRPRPTAQDAQKARFLADMFEQLARPVGAPAESDAAATEEPSAGARDDESARLPDAGGSAANAERILRLARLHAPWLRDLADRIDAMVARSSGHLGA